MAPAIAAGITNKLITYGIQKSKHKVKTSKEIGRICNISEKQTLYEKYKKIEFNRSSVRTSNKFVKQVNKKYKRTGKKISKKIKKKKLKIVKLMIMICS